MFYVMPPNGEVSLYILEDCVLTRLDYLRCLHEGTADKFDGKFEYLVENSANDEIGHFMLRLLACVSSDLLVYWVTKESLLFRLRLNNMLPKQLHRLFKQIIWRVQLYKGRGNAIEATLIQLCKFYSQPVVFKHLVSNCQNCSEFVHKVKFEIVPDLVKERELVLNNGYVLTVCSTWKRVLQSLFSAYLTSELSFMKRQAQHTVKHDPRLQFLCQKVQSYLFNEGTVHGRITLANIDAESERFPPCMRHLHSVLKSRHRLSHYARLYYSLFLKEIGMNLEDSIAFWKREYSKPHTCTSVCSHNWQSNEKKFIYSIRHMYGLEGSRRNYKTPDCNKICAGISGSAYEGGCPFKDFDMDTLRNLLHTSLTKDETEKLLNNVAIQSPETLCTGFLKLTRKDNTDNVAINSPVQFYQRMTG